MQLTYYSLKSKIKRDFGDKPSIMCLLRVLNLSLTSLENKSVNKLRSWQRRYPLITGQAIP